MYRNITYNPFNECAFLRTWTEDGKRIDTEIPFRPYLFLEQENAKDAKSIFKTPLVKKSFRNSFERKKYIDNSATTRIFYNLNAEQQCLIDLFKDTNNSPTFSGFPLKIFYLDIETASFGEFPVPEKAKDPINLITIYDSITKETHTWGLEQNYITQNCSIKYYRCKDEQDLILKFVDFWKQDYPDVVSGWSSAQFDLPYIVNRFTKIFGEEFIQQLSPVGRVRSRKLFTDVSFGKETVRWTISGISCIDYMEIYKTFSVGERESYSLNFISEYELGEGKLAFNATSLADLSQKDWKTFVDYNIQDVHLLVKLEEKLKYLQIVRLLAYKGCTNFEAALGKVAIVTGAVAIQAHKQGFIIPTFVGEKIRDSYEGGFVREPERGLSKAIVSFDVNSLYPNTIITLNISPETKIGKIDYEAYETKQEIEISLVNGHRHKLSYQEFKLFLVKHKISLSKIGVLYNQKTKGVIPNLINEIYKERVDARRQLQELKVQKSSDPKILSTIEYLNTLQYTLKIYLNSIYGTFANKHSSLMDIDNAASITITGQNVAKAGSDLVDMYVCQKYGINETLTQYGDTDSIYISIEPILKKLNITLKQENDESKINPLAYDIVSDIDKYINTEILKWASKELFSLDPRYVFKREVIADVGVFLQKKRYILHVCDEEGAPIDKFKFVGVELVRSTTPKQVKKLIEKITKTALLTQSVKETNRSYQQSFELFKQLNPDDVALRTSLNNLDRYAKGASLYKFQNATPSHVKGAIAFNCLVEEFKLNNSYEKLQTGQKVKKLYCSKNKYGLDAVSYATMLPKEFGLTVDWDRMFLKLVTQPIERLYEGIGWNLPVLGREVQTDLFDLFGE